MTSSSFKTKIFSPEIMIGLLVALVFIIAAYVAISNKRNYDKVNLFLLWEPQAQFLGYYVADDLGYFRDEGIDISIRHDLGVGDSMREVLRDNHSYVVTQYINLLDWAGREQHVQPVAIINRGCNLGWATRAPGSNLLNVLQDGQVYSWWGSQDIMLRLVLMRDGRDVSHLSDHVTTNFPSEVTENSAALVMTYNELQDLIGSNRPKVNYTSYCDLGLPIFEDVLIGRVPESAANSNLDERMARAIWKGWDWAVQHPKEAIDLIMKKNPRLDRRRQEFQLQQFATTLVNKNDSPTEYQSNLETLQALIRYGLVKNSSHIQEISNDISKSPGLRFIENGKY